MTESEHIVPLVPVRPGSSAPEPSGSEPSAPTPPKSPKRASSPFVRVGIVTGTAALVLVGAIAAMGASPSPSGSTTTPSASGDPNAGGPGPAHFGPGRGDFGDFGGFGRGFGAITVTSINGSDLALKTEDGWTRTITVDSTTTITKAGATVTVSDIAVGDEIRFAQTKNTDGTFSVTKIVVVMPSLSGEVTAKTSDSITVTRRDGTTGTINVSGSTTYTVEGVTDATLADIAVGALVHAEGTANSDGSLDAVSVTSGFRGHDGKGPGHDRLDPNKADPDASPSPSATP